MNSRTDVIEKLLGLKNVLKDITALENDEIRKKGPDMYLIELNLYKSMNNEMEMKKKKRKLHFINPKGKFILSLQEQRQGPRF